MIKPIGSLWVLEKIRTKGYFILKFFPKFEIGGYLISKFPKKKGTKFLIDNNATQHNMQTKNTK
jgi:hypothetical protein